ncbi:SDR family oxidoreductase [Arenibacter sp. GZD96]|uniref:SDR family oxidoreductase n=1 Tax=Aurantibrevibacter litoralis TaxID=3106030 RepID=UPI002B002D95|nr:SDR family oxidoreductase [Arenibacter sp. GZD-96]MEA1787366.1 SDR family oxidoreductase [Arenibacter sp. GZD-96]
MQQKVILITGGTSGIGKSIGIHLKSEGHRVYGTTRSLAKNAQFDLFPILEMNVTDTESISLAVQYILEKEGRLDVLVNNAGIGITGAIEETPEEEITKAFATNFMGPIHMMKAVLPQMRKQKDGCIINITSIAGYMGLPYRGIYSATKGALELLTEAMRMEVKHFGVHIANVAPGDFATNIAAGRYHTPVGPHSPYKESYEKTLLAMNSAVTQGMDPIHVAKKVAQIIRAKNPKIHYVVGAPLQRFSLVLKKFLPDKIYEKLLLNHYKL